MPPHLPAKGKRVQCRGPARCDPHSVKPGIAESGYLCPVNSKHQKNYMTQTKHIALVTGGSRGLGKDMALNIAKKGLDVILTYHSKKEEALAVVAEIGKLGGKATALQLNTGEVHTFDAFFKELKNTLTTVF